VKRFCSAGYWRVGVLIAVALAGCGQSSPPALSQPAPLADANATAVTVAEPATSASTDGALLVPRKTRARLEYTVTIDGNAERTESIGSFDRWSTHRSVTVSTILEADGPTGVPMIDPVGAQQSWGAVAEQDPPDRFQIWRAVRREKPEVQATIETRTDKLFLTSGKERTTCTGTARLGNDKLAVDVAVEVDAQTGVGTIAGALMAAMPVPVEMKCDLDIVGRRRQETRIEFEPFFPKIADPRRHFGGEPVQAGSAVIAQGQIEVDGSYGSILDVAKLAHVMLRWRLTRL